MSATESTALSYDGSAHRYYDSAQELPLPMRSQFWSRMVMLSCAGFICLFAALTMYPSNGCCGCGCGGFGCGCSGGKPGTVSLVAKTLLGAKSCCGGGGGGNGCCGGTQEGCKCGDKQNKNTISLKAQEKGCCGCGCGGTGCGCSGRIQHQRRSDTISLMTQTLLGAKSCCDCCEGTQKEGCECGDKENKNTISLKAQEKGCCGCGCGGNGCGCSGRSNTISLMSQAAGLRTPVNSQRFVAKGAQSQEMPHITGKRHVINGAQSIAQPRAATKSVDYKLSNNGDSETIALQDNAEDDTNLDNFYSFDDNVQHHSWASFWAISCALAGMSAGLIALKRLSTRQLQQVSGDIESVGGRLAMMSIRGGRLSSDVRNASRSVKVHAVDGEADNEKKGLSRDDEPEEYWRSADEAAGKSPLQDPMAWVAIGGLATPFLILGIALAAGIVELP